MFLYLLSLTKICQIVYSRGLLLYLYIYYYLLYQVTYSINFSVSRRFLFSYSLIYTNTCPTCHAFVSFIFSSVT
jgi:hypothetical protein